MNKKINNIDNMLVKETKTDAGRRYVSSLINEQIDRHTVFNSYLDGMDWMKAKAIESFKQNCQYPKDTKGCECKLCARWVGGHCELLDGFIEKLNSL